MNLAGSCDGCPLESYNLKLEGYNSRGESRTTGERERERERDGGREGGRERERVELKQVK